MITMRTPLLLLLSFSICASIWYILEGIPQDNWQRHRCSVLSRGRSPSGEDERNPPGCMLRSYNTSDVQICLSHQRMTIYGDVEAHEVFLTIAGHLDNHHLLNISESRVAGRDNVTMLRSEKGEISFQQEPTFDNNAVNHRYNTPVYSPFSVASYDRTSPLGDKEPATFMHSLFVFNEEDLHSPAKQVQVVLNFFCNGLIDVHRKQTQAYCCAGYTAPNTLQKLLLFAGSCSIMFYLCASLFRGTYFHSLDDNSQSTAEARRVMIAISTVSAVVIVCFVADRTALLEKASKVVDLTSFIWLAACMLLAGLTTVSRSQPNPDSVLQNKGSMPERYHYLSRQQTEEWKGWMQIVILLYHYFGLSKVLWVYQFVRLLVSSYLFMTGFGHATYFITTNDFSFRRAASVLLRNNLLNFILSFVLDTHYDLYYFPVLTSVWFLIIWTTIPRTPEAGINVRHCLGNIALSATAVRLVLEAGRMVESLLNSLDGLRLGLPKIDGHEFIFRFGLDMYIVYVGVATAIFAARPKASDQLRHHTSWISGSWSRLSPTLAVLAAVVVVPAYAVFCRGFPNKFQYNKWHPFVSPLPVIAFLILRNSTRRLSAHHSRLFAWFGRCSLETFILQYHIWLAADSRGLLRLGLFTSFDGSAHGRDILETLETVLIFAAFVAISSTTSKALSVLTRSLVDLHTEVLLIFAALWTINLAWSFSALGQHSSYY